MSKYDIGDEVTFENTSRRTVTATVTEIAPGLFLPDYPIAVENGKPDTPENRYHLLATATAILVFKSQTLGAQPWQLEE